MIKRLVWFLVGATAGIAACLWAFTVGRRTVRRLAPTQVVGEVSTGVRSLLDDLRDAVTEGRLAMREREAALRAELERVERPPSARPALPAKASLN